MTRKILFLTGTRADFGKLKPLILESQKVADVDIFVTGMHMLKQYGRTVNEILRLQLPVHSYINQDARTPVDIVLANTVHGLSLYLQENPTDLLVIHGDRVEALAGAIVGNFNGILTAHVEGGELSGTLDGMTRHSITKLAHAHFCANDEAARRLMLMGESPATIFAIGSPDIDIMLSPDLPPLAEVLEHYHISERDYGVLIYHPVWGEDPAQFEQTIRAVNDSGLPFVAIYPNNDPGAQKIIDILERHADELTILPSMRFEYFLTLLKNGKMIVGNSSAGIREAPVYGVPTINIGTRQAGRAELLSVVNVPDNYDLISQAISNPPPAVKSLDFGRGDSARQFVKIISSESFWKTPRQKKFWEGVE